MPFCGKYIELHFLEFLLYFDSNLTKINSQGCNWQYVDIGSGNGQVYRRICASLSIDEPANNIHVLAINIQNRSLEQLVCYLCVSFLLDDYVIDIAVHLTDCPRYRWGLGCNNHCNCFEPCDGATGNCTAGCIPGKMGISCQECESPSWIHKCKFTEHKRTSVLKYVCSHLSAPLCKQFHGYIIVACWGIYASDWVIISSGYGWSPVRRQAIT